MHAGGKPRSVVVVEPATPPETMAVAGAAALLLGECAGIIERVDDVAYQAASCTIRGGTIGKHIRHVLDHFRAALDGGSAGMCIDYDRRERDVPMETDRSLALVAIEELTGRIHAMDGAIIDGPVRVRVMVASDGRAVELRSTMARELAFATHHAIHHHAMVRAIAAEFGHELPEELGRAPSTLHHERRPREGSRAEG